MGLSLHLVFLVLFFVVRHREEVLSESYKKIEARGDRVFSTLKEHFVKYRKSESQNVYTYNIPDETGEILEISESVDPGTHNRLRVGDTVECYRQIIQLSGKRVVISRIKGNTEPPTNYKYLHGFSLFGMGFSGFLLLLALIHFIFDPPAKTRLR